MEKRYSLISNIGEEYDSEGDLENLEKLQELEIEYEQNKKELEDLKKKNLEQKHRIQDLEIECDHNMETIRNQNGLINFYKQYRKEHEDSDDKKKLVEYEEKIKSLEESISIKDKKMEDLKNELKEQSALNEKLVDVITNKEETIRKLEKGVNLDEEDNNNKLEEEIDNLKDKISDLENEKEKIIDKYEDKINALNKENNDYQDKLYDSENEIFNLKEINKKYEIEEAKKKGGPDVDGEIDKLYKEEIENLKKALNEAKDSKKQIKEKAQEQRESDVKEIMDLEKVVEDLRNEINELKRDKQILENNKKYTQNINEKLFKRNKELESIFGDNNDKELILNNYKSKLDKKNNEIDNLTSKCKEFKETIDQYEREKEIKLKEFQHEKEVLQSEVDDKRKKLEVALRELNEIRAKEGKGEANIQKMMDDPKQKLYDEIKEYKNEIENKNKEINELKNKLANFEIDSSNELEAQTQYLNSMIEGYKKNIENMKEQKIKAAKDFNEQNDKLQIEIGNYKVHLATIQFDMERKIVTYKKYIKKLQTKLESLGFKFKDKNYNKNNKMSYEKAKTIV